MIIGHKTQAYPVPGIKIQGRQLFIEILAVDNESQVAEAAAYVEKAMKEWAELKPGVNYTKKINCNPLRKTIIN